MATRDTDVPSSASEEHGAPDEEASGDPPIRRLAASVFIVLTLVAILASNAPDSAIKGGLLTVAGPYLAIIGLDQKWGVFAPNPRIETSNVVGRVGRADGTVGDYPLESGAGISEYWNYRWRKYGEQLWTRPTAEPERVAFARWIAREDRASGHVPVRVTLLRVTRPNLPPGPGPDTESWREVPFFTTPVGAR